VIIDDINRVERTVKELLPPTKELALSPFFSRIIDSFVILSLEDLVKFFITSTSDEEEKEKVFNTLKGCSETIIKSVATDALEAVIDEELKSLKNITLEYFPEGLLSFESLVVSLVEEYYYTILKEDEFLSTAFNKNIFKFPHGPTSFNYNLSSEKSDVSLGAYNYIRYIWGLRLVSLQIDTWFFLNPSLGISLFAKTLTYWKNKVFGNFLNDLSVGRVLNNILEPRDDAFAISLSPGWIYINFLKAYLEQKVFFPFLILLSGKVWVGWFDDISFNFSANQPLYVSVKLSFSVHPKSGWEVTDINKAKDFIYDFLFKLYKLPLRIDTTIPSLYIPPSVQPSEENIPSTEGVQ